MPGEGGGLWGIVDFDFAKETNNLTLSRLITKLCLDIFSVLNKAVTLQFFRYLFNLSYLYASKLEILATINKVTLKVAWADLRSRLQNQTALDIISKFCSVKSFRFTDESDCYKENRMLGAASIVLGAASYGFGTVQVRFYHERSRYDACKTRHTIALQSFRELLHFLADKFTLESDSDGIPEGVKAQSIKHVTM